MARSKKVSGYPAEFMTILQYVVRDGADGPEFSFPKDFGGWHDVSLRTTYQAFLKAVRNDAELDRENIWLQEMARKSEHAIVRIRDGQVRIADRRNDPIQRELRALLISQDIMDPIDRELMEAGVIPRPALAGLPATDSSAQQSASMSEPIRDAGTPSPPTDWRDEMPDMRPEEETESGTPAGLNAEHQARLNKYLGRR